MELVTRQRLSKPTKRISNRSMGLTGNRSVRHFRPFAAAALMPLLVAFSGCSTLSVTTVEGKREKKLGGVPFYVKKHQHRQVTAYAETQWTVSVTSEVLAMPTSEKGSPRTLAQLTLADSTYRGGKTIALRNAIMTGNASGSLSGDEYRALMGSVTSAISALQSESTIKDCEHPDTVTRDKYCPLVLNRIVSEVVVDTAKPHYINGRRPLAGSAKSDFTLASDMTLTSAKAEQDDKTLEQILSVLPVKEFLSKDLGVATETESEDEEAEKAAFLSKDSGINIADLRRILRTGVPVYYRLSLSATPQVILYEASKAIANPEDVTSLAPIALPNARSGAGGVQLERRIVDPTEPKDPKKDEDPGYRISGTILVPKSEPPKTEAPAKDE